MDKLARHQAEFSNIFPSFFLDPRWCSGKLFYVAENIPSFRTSKSHEIDHVHLFLTNATFINWYFRLKKMNFKNSGAILGHLWANLSFRYQPRVRFTALKLCLNIFRYFSNNFKQKNLDNSFDSFECVRSLSSTNTLPLYSARWVRSTFPILCFLCFKQHR